MIRTAVAMFLVFSALVPLSGTADADEKEEVSVDAESPTVITALVTDALEKDGTLTPEPYRGARNATAGYTGPTIVVTTVTLQDDGTPCARFSSAPGDPGSAEGRAAFDTATRLGSADTICPDSPVDAAGNATPVGAALHAWHELVELPSPELWIAPGKAVTGLPAYLEITGEKTRTASFGPDVALGYNVTIEAVSSYDIDWGDGTTATGVESQGGPYPYGDIRHSYQHVNPDNVVQVTQHWTARWTANGNGNGQSFSGVIDDDDDALYTTGQLPLAIGQIQAVRNY